MTVENVWTSFKKLVASQPSVSRLVELFESVDASVRFIPAGVVGEGVSLSEHLAYFADSAELKTEERTISYVQTPNKIVEESVLTFVHEREIKWLMPGVKPTGRRLVCPMVSPYIFF